MKPLLFALLVVGLVSAPHPVFTLGLKASDESPGSRVTLPPGSPCTDSLYIALKAKPLDAMTEREFQYFSGRDAACAEHQRTMMAAAAQKDPGASIAKAVERSANTSVAVGLFVLLVVFAATIGTT